MAVVYKVPQTLDQLPKADVNAVNTWAKANSEWVKNIFDTHSTWIASSGLEKYQAAYDGYLEEIDTRDKSRGDDVNNKLQVNYAQVVVDTVVDYMLGKPIVWSFEDKEGAAPKALLDEYRKELLRLLRGEEAQRVLAEQLRQGGIGGMSPVIAWVDENGQINYDEFPIQEVVPVYDTRGILRLVLRKYTVTVGDETFTKVEVYDRRYVYLLQGDDKGENLVADPDESVNPVEHKAARIPVSIFVNGTPSRYEDRTKRAGVSDLGNGVSTLLLAYAAAVSDKGNTVDRLLDQYLKLSNVDTDQDEVKLMRSTRAIALKSKDSDASFIAPSQDDKAVENYLDRVEKLIHRQTLTPDLTNIGGATATEIRMKYANLDIKAGKKEIYFTGAIRWLLQVLTDMLNAKRLTEANVADVYGILAGKADPPQSVTLYSADWVDFTLNRNLPQNFLEIANIVKTLSGIVPDSYLFELLWFIDDPAAALAEMKKQKETSAKQGLVALGFGGEFGSTGAQGGANPGGNGAPGSSNGSDPSGTGAGGTNPPAGGTNPPAVGN